jgi:hypothetical protein
MALRRGQAALPPSNFGSYPKQNSYNLKIQGVAMPRRKRTSLFCGLRPPKPELGQSPGNSKAAFPAGQGHRLTSGGEAEVMPANSRSWRRA